MSADESCETCRFRDGNRCRRHAPVREESKQWSGEWPHVLHNDWCGDYEPRPVPVMHHPV